MDVLEFLALVEEEYPGCPRCHYYKDQCDNGLRLGQAFMNALRGTPYYDQLTDSRFDPFYSHSPRAIERAMDFLSTKDGE